MKTIWKYNLAVTDLQMIEIPEDFEILSVQLQFGVPCLWVLVDPDTDKINRLFEIIGTGNPIGNEKRTFIDTFQTASGELVFHVFLRDAK